MNGIPIRAMGIESRDITCPRCGQQAKIPIKPDYTNPLYVMEVEKLNRFVLRSLAEQRKEIIELAQECVEAGVRPSVLRRADELLAKLTELKRLFGIE